MILHDQQFPNMLVILLEVSWALPVVAEEAEQRIVVDGDLHHMEPFQIRDEEVPSQDG
jgi:hypothetical protein